MLLSKIPEPSKMAHPMDTPMDLPWQPRLLSRSLGAAGQSLTILKSRHALLLVLRYSELVGVSKAYAVSVSQLDTVLSRD